MSSLSKVKGLFVEITMSGLVGLYVAVMVLGLLCLWALKKDGTAVLYMPSLRGSRELPANVHISPDCHPRDCASEEETESRRAQRG